MKCVLLLLPLLLWSVSPVRAGDELRWTSLPPIPDPHGVAGAFAGTADGALLVAGGANFPDRMPWDGGVKVWTDRVHVLQAGRNSWMSAGRLPRPLAYGVSLSLPEGVLCLGGSDSGQHYADCFLLVADRGTVTVRALPSLPKRCANFCGARVGRTVFVAGGQEHPQSTEALNSFWSLDLDHIERGWTERESWGGPGRILAVAAADDRAFYLVSGAALSAGPDGKPVRRYLTDAWRYQPGLGWDRLPELPRATVAAPSPAPLIPGSGFLILGGDDGRHVNFQPPQRHPGFPRSILKWDVRTGEWLDAGELPAAHVTTPIVEWDGAFVLPSGEIRPGVRSPAVWSLKTTGP